MSGIRKSPDIPQSVPKLEAELIRDAYETAQSGRSTGDAPGTGTSLDLSDTERQAFYRRILDAGVSKETLGELGFDSDE